MSANAKGSAKARARRRWWSEAARQARLEMRRRGLMVDPWVDDVAGQRRGWNVADQIGRLADELRGAGVSDATIERVIVESVVQIVSVRDGSGPRAA